MAGSPAQAGSKIGLALASGGPGGAVYEIGALRALDDALYGIDFNALHIYVGVSAGAIVGACLANGLTASELAKAMAPGEASGSQFDAGAFMTPALGEFARRCLRVPKLLLGAAVDYASHPLAVSLGAALAGRLGEAVPVGLFANEPVRRFMQAVFDKPGRTDDFRELHRKLIIVAADLDSGHAVRFGDPGFDHIPISAAVQASAAFPGLYPPVLIDGHYYVDGVLLKTLHASVALEAGADLVICVNPIVPVDTSRAVEPGQVPVRHLVEQGLPTVLMQTFRTLIHSRMSVGMAAYTPRFPDRDVVLFEPQPDDYWMFFTNIFSFASRKTVCEQAYNQTRRSLLLRFEELQPIFARHGLVLRRDVLEDEHRTVWAGADSGEPVTRTLDALLERLDSLVEARRQPADRPTSVSVGAGPS
jgi:predicted acylesterase/phospholipase RssA